MTKVNKETMKNQYDHQYNTFCRKNNDYGNSFEESLYQFGIIASIVRMSDKMKRLESLTDESKTQQVGSESLLDTLEDLSNYAAMTACWLKGIREEDGENSCGPDMIDVIKYNVQDAKNVMARSAEMEEEFNKHIPSKVENIDTRNYVLNMLSNIFRVVQMKIDKDEMLVPLDISDEAGLIAKTIVESQTKEEGGAVINNYMCTRKDIPYELKDWVYGVIMHYLYYLKKERDENCEISICADNKPVMTFSEKIPMSQFNFLHREHEIVAMLEKVLEFNYKIEWNRMTEDECVELKEIMNRLGNMVTEGSISEELMLDLINNHVKFNPESTINRLFNQIKESQKNPNEDMDIEFVSLLKLVEKFHHKIEEFKMTEADHKELEEIINRLRSIIQDAPISKEGIVSLIKKHVLLNPDVLIHQLFNQPEDKVKHFLKDLYVIVFAFRDHRVPIVTQLEYLERKKEICNKLAKIVLNGLVDFGTITAEVNSSTELHKHEKKDILESIVAAGYEIDFENFPGFNRDSEFLNKKFHIPDEILEDLKEPEEEPERKRTVLGMIFPFWL